MGCSLCRVPVVVSIGVVEGVHKKKQVNKMKNNNIIHHL